MLLFSSVGRSDLGQSGETLLLYTEASVTAVENTVFTQSWNECEAHLCSWQLVCVTVRWPCRNLALLKASMRNIALACFNTAVQAAAFNAKVAVVIYEHHFLCRQNQRYVFKINHPENPCMLKRIH